jgi:hypothetical protein
MYIVVSKGKYNTARPMAYGLWTIAYGLLPVACRLLPIAYCLLPIAYGLGILTEAGLGSLKSLRKLTSSTLLGIS